MKNEFIRWSLPDFLRERIFEPLGMTDTAFNVPEAKLPRLATVYIGTANGTLDVQARDANVTKVPAFALVAAGSTPLRVITCASRKCWRMAVC